LSDRTCDVAIIGAGTAGLAAERAARKAGATTLLIDDRFAGTTCASVGCMPSKLLIAAAEAAHAVRRAGVFGVEAAPPRIDGVAVMRRVRFERDAFVAGMQKSLAEIPAGICVQARARFVDGTTLELDNGDRIHARAVVVATGSKPNVPEPYQALGACVLTNETIFELTDLPRSIAVIGAGPLGLELAQALARLGVETEVFNEGKHIGGLHDEQVAADLLAILGRELPIHLGVTLRVSRDGKGARLAWEGASRGEKTFERVLVATGRPPALDGLGLDTAGVTLDNQGRPDVDAGTLQCGTTPLFFAGDADGERPVLHEASIEGAIAGRNAATWPKVEPGRRSVAFSVMFTDPPVAVLGDPPPVDAVIGSASYRDQGRAKIEACNVGTVRLYAAPGDGRLTGATLAAPGMDHIAHLIAWAIERGETATRLLDLPFYHPTLEEGLKTALRQICSTVNAPLPLDRDEGTAAGG
jgi:dihydrolipoamide dehydrogenase